MLGVPGVLYCRQLPKLSNWIQVFPGGGPYAMHWPKELYCKHTVEVGGPYRTHWPSELYCRQTLPVGGPKVMQLPKASDWRQISSPIVPTAEPLKMLPSELPVRRRLNV